MELKLDEMFTQFRNDIKKFIEEEKQKSWYDGHAKDIALLVRPNKIYNGNTTKRRKPDIKRNRTLHSR